MAVGDGFNHGDDFAGHARAAIIQIDVIGFNGIFLQKFLACKDSKDRQCGEHRDLIGKGDRQEIIQYADNQRGKAKPHQEETRCNHFGHTQDQPKR